MATNLHDVKLGFPAQFGCLLSDHIEALVGSPPLHRLQPSVTKLIKPLIAHTNLSKVIDTRLQNMGLSVSALLLHELPVLLKKSSKHEALCTFRILRNAMNTTWRMHEATRFSCIFGCCDSKDNIEHYLGCLVLARTRPFDSLSPFCVDSWLSREHVSKFAILYELYNYIKHHQEFSFSLLSSPLFAGQMGRDE